MRVLDRRAGGLPVIHERHDVHEARREVKRAAVAKHTHHVDRGVEWDGTERPVVGRRQHDHLVRAGNRPSDDRVEVGHDPQRPSRFVRRARAEPGDLRWRLVLVTRTERTVLRMRRHGFDRPPERLGSRGALARHDDEPVGQCIVSDLGHGLVP
jgi:hypothetical protein